MKETLQQLYTKMLTIREFETKVSYLYADGKIPGFVHLYIGEEAVAVGVCSCLQKCDTITSTHRGHGHLIAKGGDLSRMMAELFGKKTGYCKGKGGSMHIADFELGILGANGIVGGGIPIATGSAYAHKLIQDSLVSVAFFGDGATNEGVFHESMNIAAAWNLPIIFVCENNNYGVSTRFSRITKIPSIAQRAGAYGMETEVVDGNDVEAVQSSAQKAVDKARAGFGPTLIECKTFRHHGHFEGENVTYLCRNELDTWKKNDPIRIAEEKLLSSGVSEHEIAGIKKSVERAIDKAIEYAEVSEYPEGKDALEDLFHTGGLR